MTNTISSTNNTSQTQTQENSNATQTTGNGPGLGISAFVSITELVPNPWQPRKNFDLLKLIELAEDIRVNGLLQPPVVREIEISGGAVLYQIAAGERRWRAFQLLASGYEVSGPVVEDEEGQHVPNLTTPTGKAADNGPVAVTLKGKADPRFEAIPILVRDFTDEDMMRAVLSENAKRRDVSAMEEAQAFKSMMTHLGATQENFAQRMALGRSTVANRLRLLQLPEEIQTMLVEGKLGQWAGIKLLEWAKKHDLNQHYLVLIARTLVRGKIAAKDLDVVYSPDYALAKVSGIVSMDQKPGFDKAKHCAGCEFFRGDLKVSWGTQLCANPSHYRQLQTASAKEKKQELQAQMDASKTALIKEYGQDVARTPDGRAIQEKPAKDEDGINLFAQFELRNAAADFTTFNDWNGFDTTECLTCPFYGRLKSNEGEASKIYICLMPYRYRDKYKAHAELLASKQKERDQEVANNFSVTHSNPRLLNDKIYDLDPVTARFVARLIVSKSQDASFFTPQAKEVVKDWLDRHGLTSEVTHTDFNYRNYSLAWIDEALKKRAFGLQVVAMAVAFAVETSLALQGTSISSDWLGAVKVYASEALEHFKDELPDRLYLTQVLTGEEEAQ